MSPLLPTQNHQNKFWNCSVAWVHAEDKGIVTGAGEQSAEGREEGMFGQRELKGQEE